MGKKDKTIFGSGKVRIAIDVYNDLEQIFDYIAIAKQQPLTAIQVVDKIWKAIDEVAKSPFAFKECEEIPTKTKMFRRAVCMAWLIIYKVTPKEILILGVIHGHRKASNISKIRKRN